MLLSARAPRKCHTKTCADMCGCELQQLTHIVLRSDNRGAARCLLGKALRLYSPTRPTCERSMSTWLRKQPARDRTRTLDCLTASASSSHPVHKLAELAHQIIGLAISGWTSAGQTASEGSQKRNSPSPEAKRGPKGGRPTGDQKGTNAKDRRETQLGRSG